MNMLIWNCQDALNPNFCEFVNELVNLHSHAIMIVVETNVCGERAKRISEKLDLMGQLLQILLGSLEFCGCSGTLAKWEFLS